MRLEGVGRRYGARGRWVLRRVDLDLPDHAVIRVDGRNGTGKSTLLRLLAGVDAPTAGRVTGRPATAYVPERFAAALPFDAAGYLTHLGRVHGLPRREAHRRAGEWLERFGITDHAHTAMEALSKGTAQKVAVAQALMSDAELLVLDEAWTGLDTAARARLDAEVTARAAAGATVVFVDHDPARLRAVTTTAHRVEGTALVTVPTAPRRPAADPGPSALTRALVVSASRPGGRHAGPLTLPSTARLLPAVPGDADGLRVAVPAADCDAALRALLAAAPAWHIRAVAPEGAAGHGEGR